MWHGIKLDIHGKHAECWLVYKRINKMSGLILLKAAIKVSAKGSPNRKVCQANEIY